MAYIAPKKTCDKIPECWITKCSKMCKISDRVMKFIKESMKKMVSGSDRRRKKIANVEIQHGNFQGDAISSLLFVIVMMPLNHILMNFTGARYVLNRKKILIT